MQLLKCGIRLCNIAAHNEGVTDIAYIKKLDVLATSGVDSIGCHGLLIMYFQHFYDYNQFCRHLWNIQELCTLGAEMKPNDAALHADVCMATIIGHGNICTCIQQSACGRFIITGSAVRYIMHRSHFPFSNFIL